ncbi:MAG: hypothetical protein ACM3VW_10135 [Bacteroidota bacterium]
MSACRQLLLCAVVVALLLSTCLVAFCQPAAGSAATGAPTMSEADQAAAELSEDIDLLYTLNRLDLKPAQVQPLLALVEQVQQEKMKLEPQRQAALAQLVLVLRDKRALLIADKDVPADLDRKVQEARAKADGVEEEISSANAKFIPELRKVLTPDQMSIITGGDEARSQAEELLQWIRELPAADYTDEAKANAEELAEPDLNLPASAIMKIFDQAKKAASAADYAKIKSSLIDKLVPLYMPMPEAADDALLQFFSSRRLPVILKERAQ